MSVSAEEWQPRARRLADELAAAGKLASPHWRDAVCAVPRHAFTPEVFCSGSDGAWHQQDNATEQGRRDWLDRVYSNAALLTALTDGVRPTTLRSSSSMPGLVTRMLESLDVRVGHRVLEIGTGTGYNAALLCHRLGEDNVFSVDIEPDLVELAGQRLAQLGYQPTLVATDGADGLAEHAPFDRIIATCAVPEVPWAWVEQVRPGGVILTDIKIGGGAGSLVRLTRTTDGAEGPFDPTYAAFMGLRHHAANQAPTRRRPVKDLTSEPERRTTTLDPRTPWAALVVWFLAVLDLGDEVLALGYTGNPATSELTATSITAADGSWAEVALADNDGTHHVVEGGPRRIWRTVEAAHQTWQDLDQPDWNRFGLTVTANHQHIWLDTRTGNHSWTISPSTSHHAVPAQPT